MSIGISEMDCCFCDEYNGIYQNQFYNLVGKSMAIKSRIIAETPNWYAVPSIGCFTVGYVLLICKQHYQSLANVNIQLYKEMLELKHMIEEKLLVKLGIPCLAFEHGSTIWGCTAANSVEHVHLHIVPFPRSIWNDMCQEYILDDFTYISDYIKLFREWQTDFPKTYLLFQDTDKRIYYKSDVEGMPSQFFRRCLSPYFNISLWNWRQEYGINNIVETLKIFE